MDRIGCLNEQVQQVGYGQGGESQSHKLLRAAGSLPGSEDICTKAQIQQDTPMSRQHHSNFIHQEEGGTHSSQLSNLAVEIWK